MLSGVLSGLSLSQQRKRRLVNYGRLVRLGMLLDDRLVKLLAAEPGVRAAILQFSFSAVVEALDARDEPPHFSIFSQFEFGRIVPATHRRTTKSANI